MEPVFLQRCVLKLIKVEKSEEDCMHVMLMIELNDYYFIS